MIVVSYYTPAYADEAAGLIESLERFGLKHDVRAVPSLGDWCRNTQRKAEFMRSMLDAYDGEDVLWLDADARVRQYPVLLDVISADVAVHYRDGHELLSGTLWMRPGQTTRALCDRWVRYCDENPGEWDQRALQRAIGDMEGLRVFDLPAAYTLIWDTMAHQGPPVIEHMQASRRLKHAG